MNMLSKAMAAARVVEGIPVGRRSVVRVATALVSLIVVGAFATSASGGITVQSWHKLGEDDPGATVGGAGADPTADSVGSLDLAKNGAPTYAVGSDMQGSSLAMEFGGAPTGDYYAGTHSFSFTDNFGVEAVVKPSTLDYSDGAGRRGIVYVGDSGGNGFGLLVRDDGSFRLLAGGNGGADSDAGFLEVGEWAHLAIVRQDGITTGYFNREAVTLENNEVGVGAPSEDFAIGATTNDFTQWFPGTIDEARVFTFESGQFDPQADLLVPEPATMVLLGLGGVGLLARRRRRA